MKILFQNATLLPEYGFGDTPVQVLVEDKKIASITKELPFVHADEIVDCKGNLLMPAFYNTHCHAAMTLFRGYGEDLPLQRWLDERILPAEDRLNRQNVKIASLLAIAEMLAAGIVSFSDMYMFEEATAEAVIETGVKANLSRCLVSFDPQIDMKTDKRLAEALALAHAYQGAGEGRVRIDLSLHGEYTNVPRAVSYVAELAKRDGYRMQLHLSETKKEQEGCIRRNGMTPAAFFASCGVFDVPTTAAHCVYVTDEDIAILKEKNVTVSHNPVSNLKLGSGIMPFEKLKKAGVSIALGSDGVASNNRLDILREMQTAAILHKGVSCDPTVTTAQAMLPMATRNGALAQGRLDCGRVEVGYRADLILLDRNALHNQPCFDPYAMLAYSAERNDVLLTMVDGRILYRNGSYTTIDMERLMAESQRVFASYFA